MGNLPDGQCALFDEGYFEGGSFIMVRAAYRVRLRKHLNITFFLFLPLKSSVKNFSQTCFLSKGIP